MDGVATVPDVLQSATLQTMVTPPFSYRSYALGMYVDGSKWYHGGSYFGSRSHWMRNGSGFCAVVFVNSSASGLQELLESIVASPVEWPDKNLFTP